MIDAGALGENVAFHRRRRGLSQTQFAKLLDRSESWVSQVERGARVIDRLTVLTKVAEVLDVPLSELLGDQAPFPVRPQSHPDVADLRRALGTPYGITALVEGSYHHKTKVPKLKDLDKRVNALWDLAHRSQLGELGQRLAELIPDLERAMLVYDDDDLESLLELMVTTYQVTAALFSKLGEADAVWVAGDRAIRAASQLGDALLSVASAYRLALALVSSQRLEEALHVAETAADALEPYCSDDQPESWSIWGALHLVMAVASARSNDAVGARGHLRKAAHAGDVVGDGHNDFDTEFGPTNVALHAVAVEVELGNAGEALRLADHIEPADLSPERRSAHRMDLAAANIQRRQPAEAVRLLIDAEEETPEQVRRNPRARQIVLDLLRSQRGDIASLTDLANRMNLSNDLPVQKVLDSTSRPG